MGLLGFKKPAITTVMLGIIFANHLHAAKGSCERQNPGLEHQHSWLMFDVHPPTFTPNVVYVQLYHYDYSYLFIHIEITLLYVYISGIYNVLTHPHMRKFHYLSATSLSRDRAKVTGNMTPASGPRVMKILR